MECRCGILEHASDCQDTAGFELGESEGVEAVASILVLSRWHVCLRIPAGVCLAMAQLNLDSMLSINACDWFHSICLDEPFRWSIEQRRPWPLLHIFGLAIRESSLHCVYFSLRVLTRSLLLRLHHSRRLFL